MEDLELKPTNTLVFGAFDALDKDAPEDPFTDVLSISAMNMEESRFISSVEFLKNLNNSYTESKIKLYNALKESADTTAMLESFSDYYVQVDAIVNEFLKFLRTKIDRFIDSSYSFIDASKIITDHKKALTEEISTYEDDSSEGYNFTIKENVPDLSLLDNFNASLFDELYRPNVDDLTSDNVKEAVDKIALEQDYQRFRAQILGVDGTLTDSEFVRALHMIFRDNTSEVIELDIYDAKVIRDIAERWFKHYDIKSTLNKQYDQIEKAYKGVLDKISKVCKNNNGMTISAFSNMMPGDLGVDKIEGKDVNTAGVMMSADMMLQIDIYTKAKMDQLQKYTDITCMVMTAKMDAIMDMIKQDRALMLKAIEVLDHPDAYYDARKHVTTNEDKHPKQDESPKDESFMSNYNTEPVKSDDTHILTVEELKQYAKDNKLGSYADTIEKEV